jgi:acyl carrier protein
MRPPALTILACTTRSAAQPFARAEVEPRRRTASERLMTQPTRLLLVSFLLLTQAARADPSSADLNLVRSVVAAELGIPVSSVADSKTLANQQKPGDSLHFVEIVLRLETRTNKKITDATVRSVIGDFSMKTVSEQITVKQLAEVLCAAPVSK